MNNLYFERSSKLRIIIIIIIKVLLLTNIYSIKKLFTATYCAQNYSETFITGRFLEWIISAIFLFHYPFYVIIKTQRPSEDANNDAVRVWLDRRTVVGRDWKSEGNVSYRDAAHSKIIPTK